jgi:glycosyltransferase involved in cell wall biosynthesis
MKTSVIIPARNEIYLQQTILDILKNARGEIEILAILDGYWCPSEEIVDDARVNYLHFSTPKGLRNAVNKGVALAKGEYILKCDAHVSFAEGFDEVLKADMQPNWIVIPSRYPLDPVKWEREARTDNKYPICYESIDPVDLHGVEWRERRDEREDILIDETLSAQGSAWFMTKKFFEELGGLDEENYGTFYLEFQELLFKTYSIGGKVMVNKKTSYCHWHKVQSRGYSLPKDDRDIAVQFIKKWITNTAWDKQIISFEDIIEHFMPMPNWPENWKEVLNVK